MEHEINDVVLAELGMTGCALAETDTGLPDHCLAVDTSDAEHLAVVIALAPASLLPDLIQAAVARLAA